MSTDVRRSHCTLASINTVTGLSTMFIQSMLKVFTYNIWFTVVDCNISLFSAYMIILNVENCYIYGTLFIFL
jgi:hypothetical protein